MSGYVSHTQESEPANVRCDTLIVENHAPVPRAAIVVLSAHPSGPTITQIEEGNL
jgi:hypothetical protein